MTGSLWAGAAIRDITPPVGLPMAGFAARTEPASGTHDPLTVRAVCVNDTAIVCADVIGLHEDSCRRIRRRAALPADNIIVSALHTHGGPVSMPGRIGTGLDADYLRRLEDSCVDAINTASENRRPATLFLGNGADPGIAKNRRHADGLVDPSLPVLKLQGNDGRWIAVITSYACHPVVLGADNTLWTADYPGVVRERLEAAHPDAVALFLTGCTGDANNGHTAHDSFTVKPNATRTFAEAARIGGLIADSAVNAQTRQATGAGAHSATAQVTLDMARRESQRPEELASEWRAEQVSADAGRSALLDAWIRWADTIAAEPLTPWSARVTVLDWAGTRLVAFPGEVFAETALACRRTISGSIDHDAIITFCFAEGCPGYLPPSGEYCAGGYEVDEAHRYYGMPAGFAAGSAERLLDCAVDLNDQLIPLTGQTS